RRLHFLKTGRKLAPTSRRHGLREYIDRLALELASQLRMLPETRFEPAARAVHEGESENALPFAENSGTHELSRLLDEIVRLAASCRSFEKRAGHGFSLNTRVVAVDSDARCSNS